MYKNIVNILRILANELIIEPTKYSRHSFFFFQTVEIWLALTDCNYSNFVLCIGLRSRSCSDIIISFRNIFFKAYFLLYHLIYWSIQCKNRLTYTTEYFLLQMRDTSCNFKKLLKLSSTRKMLVFIFCSPWQLTAPWCWRHHHEIYGY